MGIDRSPEKNNFTCKNVVLQNQVFNEDERQHFIKPYYRRRYSMFKLIELFHSSNKTTCTLNKLGNYVYKCFEKRTEITLRRNYTTSTIMIQCFVIYFCHNEFSYLYVVAGYCYTYNGYSPCCIDVQLLQVFKG